VLPLILCLLTQGDEPPANDLTAPRSRPAVTTTAARVTVITGDELRRSGQDNLPRALAVKAGLWLQESDWGGGSPVIRGLLGNRILVIVDGVPVNDSTTGLEPNSILNTIDIGIVDRVEVRRGPASVLHGTDAMGGVIEIWTRRRRPGAQDPADHPRPYEGEITGNYDTVVRGGYGNLKVSGGLEEHSLIAVGSLHDYNDLTRMERDPLSDIGYKGHSAFGAYEYAVDDRKTLRLSAQVNRDNGLQRVDQLVQGFDQPLGPIYQASQFSRRDRKGLVVSYTDNKPGRVFEALQLRAGVRSYKEQSDLRKWDYTDPESPVPASTRTFEEYTTTGLSLAGDWKKTAGDDHLLTFGFDIDHDDVESTRKEYGDDPEDPDHYVDRSGPFGPGAQYTRSGVFLQDEILAFEPWCVTAGQLRSRPRAEPDGGPGQRGDEGGLGGGGVALRHAHRGLHRSRPARRR